MFARYFFWSLFFFASILQWTACQAQIRCGEPPALPTKAEESESIKRNLSAKAQVLSRFVGSADLDAAVNDERRIIYQSADKIAAAQKDAYLLYLFCTIISNDRNMTSYQMLDALEKFRRPPPQAEERTRAQCVPTYTKVPYVCPTNQYGYIAVCTTHICDGSNNGAGTTKIEKNVQCKPLEKGANISYKGCPTDKLGFTQLVSFPRACTPNQYGGEDCKTRNVTTTYCLSLEEATKISQAKEPIISQ